VLGFSKLLVTFINYHHTCKSYVYVQSAVYIEDKPSRLRTVFPEENTYVFSSFDKQGLTNSDDNKSFLVSVMTAALVTTVFDNARELYYLKASKHTPRRSGTAAPGLQTVVTTITNQKTPKLVGK
jgi:hypothetical protein